MNRKSFFFKILPFFVMYFLFSCKSKNHINFPAGIVSPDTMVQIISDANILQASAQLGFSQSAKDTSIQLAYQRFWKKHNLTDSSYNQNMRFYCDHPKLLDSVYEHVLSNLNHRKAELMGPKMLPVKGAK